MNKSTNLNYLKKKWYRPTLNTKIWGRWERELENSSNMIFFIKFEENIVRGLKLMQHEILVFNI